MKIEQDAPLGRLAGWLKEEVTPDYEPRWVVLVPKVGGVFVVLVFVLIGWNVLLWLLGALR